MSVTRTSGEISIDAANGKTIGAAGGGMLIGVLITGLFLPMILKSTLTDVANEAARTVAVQMSADAKPLVEQAIIDVRADVKAELVRARQPIAETNDKAQGLMDAGVELMRKKLEREQTQ